MYSGLSAENAQQLAVVASLRKLSRGESLFFEGDAADRLYTVVSGRVKVYRAQASGKDLILTILGPGDPVGAVAIYRGIPFPANAEALEDAEVLSVPRSEFFGLLERSPTFVRGLLQGMTMRLVELTGRLSSVISSRVEPRFARLFLRLAEDTGRETDEGVFVRVRLSRQELADLTGTTIETCIRIMSRWGREGVVRTLGEGFLVIDRDRLREISES